MTRRWLIQVHWRQIAVGWAIDNGAEGVIARAVTGTVPGFLGRVPGNYAAEMYAEAILYAAEHPVRDLFVGSAGKALSTAAALAPRLVDKVMEFGMFHAQELDHLSASHHKGLDSPSGSLLERGGYPGHVAKTSLYTKAMMHPWIASGLFVAGLDMAYAVNRTFSRNGSVRSVRKGKASSSEAIRQRQQKATESMERLYESP